MNDLYGEVVLDHYRHPHNRGTLECAEATYEDENTLCGDALRLDLAFDPPLDQQATPEERRIKEVRFNGQGCVISQAAASLLTDLVAGRTAAQVKALTTDDLLDELGITLSPARLKCALLSFKVLKAALYGADIWT